MLPDLMYWAFSSLLIFKGPASLLSSQHRTIDFLLKETTTTMSLLENYKKVLHNFDTQCSKVARNDGTDCSDEFKSTMEALRTAFSVSLLFMLSLSSCHRLTISDQLASHIETKTVLTEDEQTTKYDILEIRRLMRVTSMFPVKPQWRLLEKNDTFKTVEVEVVLNEWMSLRISRKHGP